MKKINIIALIIGTLLFSGCRSSTITESQSTSNASTKPSGEISVRIANWYLDKNNDEDLLIIEYEWTNNSDEAKAFNFTINDTVFQNGIECNTVYGYKGIDISKKSNKIQPGVTYTVEVAYQLQDRSAVSVELTKFIGADVYLRETLDLGGGTGTTSADTSAETTIEIVNVFLSEDYKGDEVLVVDYMFTNGENKPNAFLYMFRTEAFQHGIECDDTVIGCDDIDSSRWLNEVQSGVTYTVSIGYHITDYSDVEIRVTDFMGDRIYYTANVDFPKVN